MKGRRARACNPPTLSTRLLLSFCLLILIGVAATNCNRGRVENPPAVSSIHIAAASGGPLVIRTPAAEFRLYPTGYLQASLLQNGPTSSSVQRS